MRYRRLGDTGLEVSVIGLGTWQFSGEWGKQFSQPEVDALIGRAGELGVNLIDTAECYGDHLAESFVGRAVAADRERWVVAAKFGHRCHVERMHQPEWDPVKLRTDQWSPAEVVALLEDSLRALGTDHVDIYQAHGPDAAEFATPGLWEILQHPAIGAVIPGSKSIDQLESNVAAADLDLVSDAHPLAVTHHPEERR